ncbi:hypothetical protein GGF46_001244 [Coemansia sp. RSA 552]|nr:hypothetical protein GGF46_001244 [Coemansia sp. RSA 552]
MVRRAQQQGGGTRRGSDGAQIADWYSSLPQCTRFLLGTTLLLTLLCGLQAVPYYHVLLDWPKVTKQFQVWRLASSFLVTMLSINGLIHMIMLYRHSLALETEEFAGRTADYAWFLLFCMLGMASVSWITRTVLLSDGLLLAMVTLWSLHRAEEQVKFLLGFKFPARYLPYVLMATDLLLHGGRFPYAMFFGWGAAQAYYYLSEDLPAQGGLNYIPTPQLLYRFFGQVRRADPRTTRVATVRNPVHQQPGDGHFWGRGRTLG